MQCVYGNDCISRAQALHWFFRIKDGRETLEDNPHTASPVSVHEEEKCGKCQRDFHQ